VGRDEIRQRLRPRRLCIGVIAHTRGRYKNLGLAHRARLRIPHRHRHARVVDEELLPGLVLLAHPDRQLTLPRPVQVAEPAVLEALRIAGFVLLPQHEQRHAPPLQFVVDHLPVRQWPRRAVKRRRGKQQRLQRRLTHPLRQGPADPGPLRPPQILPHRRAAHAATVGNLAPAQTHIKP